ncbi:MAG: YIP1 family protein [Chlorobi bacterium]|nr:YIP1 family protein [Chlorobiota bacterium]
MEINESEKFSIHVFVDDSVRSIIAPKKFFRKLPSEQSMSNSVYKVLLYGLVSGIFSYLLMLSGFGELPESIWFNEKVGFLIVFALPFAYLVVLFIGSGFLYLLLFVFGVEKSFETYVHVVASLMVVGVVRTLLHFSILLNYYLWMMSDLLLTFWELYMFYNALIYTLNVKEKRARALVVVLSVLVVSNLFMDTM